MSIQRSENDALLDRIDNWARWTFEGGGSAQNGCASAERRYVAPKLTEAAAAARGMREPIDYADGERIDTAVGKLHATARRLMVSWHIDRRQFTGRQGMCKIFQMSIRDLEVLHREAIRGLGQQIRMMDHLDAVSKTRYKSTKITEQRSTQKAA